MSIPYCLLRLAGQAVMAGWLFAQADTTTALIGFSLFLLTVANGLDACSLWKHELVNREFAKEPKSEPDDPWDDGRLG